MNALECPSTFVCELGSGKNGFTEWRRVCASHMVHIWGMIGHHVSISLWWNPGSLPGPDGLCERRATRQMQGSSDERTQTHTGRRQLSLSRQRLRWYICLQETRLNAPFQGDAGNISQTPVHITRICYDAGLHWAIAESLWTLSRLSKKPRECIGKLAVCCLCRVKINIQCY